MSIYLQSTNIRNILEVTCQRPLRARCAIAIVVGTVETVVNVAKFVFSSLATALSLGLWEKSRRAAHRYLWLTPAITFGVAIAVAGCVNPLWVKRLTDSAEAKAVHQAQQAHEYAQTAFDIAVNKYFEKASKSALGHSDTPFSFDVEAIRNRVSRACHSALRDFHANPNKGSALPLLDQRLRDIVQQHSSQDILNGRLVLQSAHNAALLRRAQQAVVTFHSWQQTQLASLLDTEEHQAYRSTLEERLNEVLERQKQAQASIIARIQVAVKADPIFDEFNRYADSFATQWPSLASYAIACAKSQHRCLEIAKDQVATLKTQGENIVLQADKGEMDIPTLRQELDKIVAQKEAEFVTLVGTLHQPESAEAVIQTLKDDFQGYRLADHIEAALQSAAAAHRSAVMLQQARNVQLVAQAKKLTQEHLIAIKAIFEQRQTHIVTSSEPLTLDLISLDQGLKDLMVARERTLQELLADMEAADPVDPLFSDFEAALSTYQSQAEEGTLAALVEVDSMARSRQKDRQELLKTIRQGLTSHLALLDAHDEAMIVEAMKRKRMDIPTLRDGLKILRQERSSQLEVQIADLESDATRRDFTAFKHLCEAFQSGLKSYEKSLKGATLPIVKQATEVWAQKVALFKPVQQQIQEHLAQLKKQSGELLAHSSDSECHLPTLKKSLDDIVSARTSALATSIKELQSLTTPIDAIAQFSSKLSTYQINPDNADVQGALKIAKDRLLAIQAKEALVQKQLDQAYEYLSGPVRTEALQRFEVRFQKDLERQQEQDPLLTQQEFIRDYFSNKDPKKKVCQAMVAPLTGAWSELYTNKQREWNGLLRGSKADANLDALCEGFSLRLEGYKTQMAACLHAEAAKAYAFPAI